MTVIPASGQLIVRIKRRDGSFFRSTRQAVGLLVDEDGYGKFLTVDDEGEIAPVGWDGAEPEELIDPLHEVPAMPGWYALVCLPGCDNELLRLPIVAWEVNKHDDRDWTDGGSAVVIGTSDDDGKPTPVSVSAAYANEILLGYFHADQYPEPAGSDIQALIARELADREHRRESDTQFEIQRQLEEAA